MAAGNPLVSVRMDSSLIEAIDRVAAADDRTRASVIRVAVRRYLDEVERGEADAA